MTPTEALARALDGDDTPPWEVAERLAALGYEVRPIANAESQRQAFIKHELEPMMEQAADWPAFGMVPDIAQAAEAADREAADGDTRSQGDTSAAVAPLDVEALAAALPSVFIGWWDKPDFWEYDRVSAAKVPHWVTIATATAAAYADAIRKRGGA